MSTLAVTASGDLFGTETVSRFAAERYIVADIDNDTRAYISVPQTSTKWSSDPLAVLLQPCRHHAVGICESAALERIFKEYADDFPLIIHTLGQPSHDRAAKEPLTDFGVNAVSTVNLLELMRQYTIEVPFIFTSTNKVYGDIPDRLPLLETDTRWEVEKSHSYAEHRIDETMSIDQCKHSIFGVSKLAAQITVQESGRYWDIKINCFHGECVTGLGLSRADLLGLLSYLKKCAYAYTGHEYRIFGYKGEHGRDNIQSHDLVECFLQFFKAPRVAEVYNLERGRHSNCSMMDGIAICEESSGNTMNTTYVEDACIGDHIWWGSDALRFQQHCLDSHCQLRFAYLDGRNVPAVRGVCVAPTAAAGDSPHGTGTGHC